jgi:energy-coupling factor transporter ATP-binding protein EcfA2
VPEYYEIRAAERWLELVGLEEKRADSFAGLSYGEQRVAFVLRAVVKAPSLLILDEPCHGLDSRRRSEIMTIIDFVSRNTRTTLIYVTHDPAEYLACTRQTLKFDAERGWLLTNGVPHIHLLRIFQSRTSERQIDQMDGGVPPPVLDRPKLRSPVAFVGAVLRQLDAGQGGHQEQ